MFLKEGFHHEHYPCEIERYETADNPKPYEERDALGYERLALNEKELEFITGEYVGNRCSRNRCYEQRHYGDRGEVEHKHLEREKHPGYRSLENAGYTCRGTASHKYHKHAWRQAECLPQVGAYGGPGCRR